MIQHLIFRAPKRDPNFDNYPSLVPELPQLLAPKHLGYRNRGPLVRKTQVYRRPCRDGLARGGTMAADAHAVFSEVACRVSSLGRLPEALNRGRRVAASWSRFGMSPL